MSTGLFPTVSRLALSISMAVMLAACVHTLPSDAPLAERVLLEKGLRAKLVERAATDSEFLHEILHQVGEGPDGNQRFARLLAEHLSHHPATAHVLFYELASRREFQDWLIERLRSGRTTP